MIVTKKPKNAPFKDVTNVESVTIRKRGRPKKSIPTIVDKSVNVTSISSLKNSEGEIVVKKRGRPRSPVKTKSVAKSKETSLNTFDNEAGVINSRGRHKTVPKSIEETLKTNNQIDNIKRSIGRPKNLAKVPETKQLINKVSNTTDIVAKKRGTSKSDKNLNINEDEASTTGNVRVEKRVRGRPRSLAKESTETIDSPAISEKKRGRPKSDKTSNSTTLNTDETQKVFEEAKKLVNKACDINITKTRGRPKIDKNFNLNNCQPTTSNQIISIEQKVASPKGLSKELKKQTNEASKGQGRPKSCKNITSNEIKPTLVDRTSLEKRRRGRRKSLAKEPIKTNENLQKVIAPIENVQKKRGRPKIVKNLSDASLDTEKDISITDKEKTKRLSGRPRSILPLNDSSSLVEETRTSLQNLEPSLNENDTNISNSKAQLVVICERSPLIANIVKKVDNKVTAITRCRRMASKLNLNKLFGKTTKSEHLDIYETKTELNSGISKETSTSAKRSNSLERNVKMAKINNLPKEKIIRKTAEPSSKIDNTKVAASKLKTNTVKSNEQKSSKDNKVINNNNADLPKAERVNKLRKFIQEVHYKESSCSSFDDNTINKTNDEEEETEAEHIPIYKKCLLEEKKPSKVKEKDDPYKIEFEYSDELRIKKAKNKKRDNEDSINEYDKKMDQIMNKIRNKLEKNKGITFKKTGKKAPSKPTIAKTEYVKSYLNSVYSNKKIASKIKKPRKETLLKPPKPKVVQKGIDSGDDEPAHDDIYDIINEAPSTSRQTGEINIISNVVVHPADNDESIFDISFSQPDANSTVIKPQEKSATPWRLQIQSLKKNPHLLHYKKSSLPNYDQEMILDSTYLENSMSYKSQTPSFQKTPVYQAGLARTIADDSQLSNTFGCQREMSKTPGHLLEMSKTPGHQSKMSKTPVRLSEMSKTPAHQSDITDPQPGPSKTPSYQSGLLKSLAYEIEDSEIVYSIEESNTTPAKSTKTPLKSNATVQSSILDFVGTSTVTKAAKKNANLSLFDNDQFSPIKATHSPTKRKSPKKAKRNMCDKENDESQAGVVSTVHTMPLVTSNIINVVAEKTVVENEDGIDNYFGFDSTLNASENKVAYTQKKKSDQQAKPTRIELKEVKKVIVEAMPSTSTSIPCPEVTEVTEELHTVDSIQSTATQIEESHEPLGLFEEFEPIFKKKNRRSYERVKFAHKRYLRETLEEDEDEVEEERRPKKRKKDILTKAEQKEAEKWYKEFNTMCEDVDHHELTIE